MRLQGAIVCGYLLILAAMTPASAAESASPPAEFSLPALDACTRANLPATLQVKQLTLSTADASGQGRTLKGRLFVQRQDGGLRMMLKLDSPPDLKGAAYLLREDRGQADGMYMYLPALNKTRRILGGSQHNPLFGTDVSYADVKQIALAFSGGQVRLEAPQSVQGRPSQVVLLTPDLAQQSPYSAIRAWVDAQSCVPIRADFIAGTQTRKRYSASITDIRQSGSYRYVAKSLMEDLVSHSRTTLQLEDIVSDKQAGDQIFNPHSFQLGN